MSGEKPNVDPSDLPDEGGVQVERETAPATDEDVTVDDIGVDEGHQTAKGRPPLSEEPNSGFEASDEDVADAVDGGGTTETDYRWRWLSTLWAIGYGFGFPLWVALPVPLDVPGPVLATLLLAWGGTVVYVIGPENVEAWQSLRGGDSGS